MGSHSQYQAAKRQISHFLPARQITWKFAEWKMNRPQKARFSGDITIECLTQALHTVIYWTLDSQCIQFGYLIFFLNRNCRLVVWGAHFKDCAWQAWKLFDRMTPQHRAQAMSLMTRTGADHFWEPSFFFQRCDIKKIDHESGGIHQQFKGCRGMRHQPQGWLCMVTYGNNIW